MRPIFTDKIISLRDSSTKKTIYANPLSSYFCSTIIPRISMSALEFLQNFFSEPRPISIAPGSYFFPSCHVVFFLDPKGAFASRYLPFPVIRITSSYLLFRLLLKRAQPLYFLKKEQGSFLLCDGRYAKEGAKLRALPLVAISPEPCRKTPEILQQEIEKLFPERVFPIFYRGDTTDRCKSPLYPGPSRIPAKDILLRGLIRIKRARDR